MNPFPWPVLGGWRPCLVFVLSPTWHTTGAGEVLLDNLSRDDGRDIAPGPGSSRSCKSQHVHSLWGGQLNNSEFKMEKKKKTN